MVEQPNQHVGDEPKVTGLLSVKESNKPASSDKDDDDQGALAPSFTSKRSGGTTDSRSTVKSIESTEATDTAPDDGKSSGTDADDTGSAQMGKAEQEQPADASKGPAVEQDGMVPQEGQTENSRKKPRKPRAERLREEQGSPSDTEGELESGDEDVYALSSTIGWASELQSKNLYEAFRMKLERRQKLLEKKGHKKKDNQGPALLKGLADYMRVLEKRIGKLETEHAKSGTEATKGGSGENRDGDGRASEGKNSKMDGRASEGKDGKMDGSASDGKDSKRDADVDEDQVLTSFHDYQHEETLVFTELDRKGPFCDESESFISKNPHYVLRVLFKWNETYRNPKKHDSLFQPDPAQVDVLGIRINSRPIASFLESQMNFKVDCLSITQTSKPFRLLIRNAAAIQHQLDALEAKYGQSFATPRPEEVKTTPDLERTESDGAAATTGQNVTPGSSVETSAKEPAAEVEEDAERREDAVELYDSKKALLHFRELMAFIDRYLGQKRRLYDDIQLGIPPRVTFEDVWMLFDFGDTILCPRRGNEEIWIGEDLHASVQRHVPQAYRVIASAGGVLRGRRFVPRAAESGDRAGREALKSTKAVAADPSEPQSQQFYIKQLLELIDEQQSGEKASDRFTSLLVSCYYIDFNGARLSAVPDIFKIRPFDGEMEVTSLNVFPIAYQRHLGTQDKAIDLHARGLKFLEWTRVTHLSYDGQTVGETQEEITSPVIIDFKLAFQELPDLVPSFGRSERIWDWTNPGGLMELPMSTCENPTTTCCLKDQYMELEKARSGKILPTLKTWLGELEVGGDKSQTKRLKDQLRDKDLHVLLPGVAHGFALHSRKWLQFDIGRLKEVEVAEGESGWDDLVLPATHRSMVQSMVETHTAGSRQGSSGPGASGSGSEGKYDIGLIQGKGKGCIILLHGVPGVGKTSTAECVAAYTRRPLFPITCGDIGYEPEKVEANLEKLFRLAHKWGCVMLIDEADVFLAERDKADVKRNGLVSVFLRVLEYYSGILFLTTNRVGAFDEAFRSRIHLSLYYPRLDERQTYEVWDMNIRRIEKLNRQREADGLQPVAYSRKRIHEWAQLNYKALRWNGRQIQNAFQTALALAEFEVRRRPLKKRQPKITVEHFRTIGDATIQFDNYLIETHMGADQSKAAKQKQIRSDQFGADGKPAKDREIQMPISHKPKPKRRAPRARGACSDDTESSQNETDSEEEEEHSSQESDSESDVKSRKKSKKTTKKKTTDSAKVKVEVEIGEKDKVKAAEKGSRRKKRTKKDQSSDEETEEEEESEEERASKKKRGAKKQVKKTKAKKRMSSDEEEDGNEDEVQSED
ncbi:hypothetical protein RB597_010213 [Gaeumannomyces tritici]